MPIHGQVQVEFKAQRGASTLLSELRREALLKGIDAKLTIKSLQYVAPRRG
jgi:hypothetical protein